MSNSDKKKTSFKPLEFFTITWGMVTTLFLGWVVFNIVLAFSCWFFVRLTHYDTDPVKVRFANYLTKDRLIDPLQVHPGVQTIRHVFRLDTDGDGFREWVVFYVYDAATAKDRKVAQSGPFGAAVYDIDKCRPPAIASYELRPYDYDYVGENLTIWSTDAPEMRDVNGDQKPELVLHVGGNLSVFRWFDRSDACSAPAPGTQGYEVLGTFRGSGGVSIGQGGSIEVLDRGFFDRSQIATRRVYKPDQSGSYLRPGGGGLYEPTEVGLAFAVGEPITPTETYYPEKAVLAFYLELGKANDKARALLCPDGRMNVNRDSFGVALPRSQMAYVLVKEITYTPDVEDERQHKSRDVSVLVVGVRRDGTADEEHRQRVLWKVRGLAKPGALPYNCVWCLESYQVQP